MARKVFILKPAYGYADLFLDFGMEVVSDIKAADLICFTGGEDVSPHLYNEQPHRLTHASRARDVEEEKIYKQALADKIPMVGICRGGQFLNVMNGGRMYQHVTKHIGDHMMKVRATGDIILVSSTHHQMMRAGGEGIVLCVAFQGGTKEYMSGALNITQVIDEDDTEVVWYRDTKCLCFQPHPEFSDAKYAGMQRYFFDMIEKRLFPKES